MQQNFTFEWDIFIIRNVGSETRERNGRRGISCLLSKVKVSVALAFLLNMAECNFLLYNCFLFSWMWTCFQKKKKVPEVLSCVLCLNTCTISYVPFILDTASRWWLSSFLCCSGFPGCIIREQNNCSCWLYFFFLLLFLSEDYFVVSKILLQMIYHFCSTNTLAL